MTLQARDKLGSYDIVDQIAVGGMAEIYLAKSQGVAGFVKHCALKVIHADYSADEEFVQMLIDEAKIAVRLSHANVVQIYELARHNDTYYIAMEYLDGADLFRVMRRLSEMGIAVPLDIAVYIAQEICTGLHYAHHRRDEKGRPINIVHRDISPQNILLSYAGEVKIADFGIAKAAMRTQQTQAGVIKGKCYYMSPEQAWGKRVDQRTDVFSAGIVLYEVLTGGMLYLEDDASRLLQLARQANIEQPSRRRQDIPPALERVVMKALAPDLDHRWQTAGEMQSQLTTFLYSYAPDFTAERLARLVRVALNDEDPGSLPRMDPFAGHARSDWPAPDDLPGEWSGNYAFADESSSDISGLGDRTMVSGPPEMLAHASAHETPDLRPLHHEPLSTERWFDDLEDLSQTRRVDSKAPPETPPSAEPTPAPAEVIVDERDTHTDTGQQARPSHGSPSDHGAIPKASSAISQPPSDAPQASDTLDSVGSVPAQPPPGIATPDVAFRTTAPWHQQPARPGAEPPRSANQPSGQPSSHRDSARPPAPSRGPRGQARIPAAPLRPPKRARTSLLVLLGVTIVVGLVSALLTLAPRRTGKTASIECVSVPQKARISLDGNATSYETPATIPVSDPSKPLRIGLSLAGHREWSAMVVFRPGEQHKRVVASLEPSMGRLIMESEPSGATVALDGHARGTTPLDLKGLRLDRPITVKIHKPGFEPVTRQVTWGSDKWQRFKVVLAPLPSATPGPAIAPTGSPR